MSSSAGGAAPVRLDALLVGAGFTVTSPPEDGPAPPRTVRQRRCGPGWSASARWPTPSVPVCACSSAASTRLCTRLTPVWATPAPANGSGPPPGRRARRRRPGPGGGAGTRRRHDRLRQAGHPHGGRGDPEEYTVGYTRVSDLVAWLQPGAVCFVGLSGWRTVVDRRAVAGRQPYRRRADVPPMSCRPPADSTPAHRWAELARHLAAAAALGSSPVRVPRPGRMGGRDGPASGSGQAAQRSKWSTSGGPSKYGPMWVRHSANAGEARKPNRLYPRASPTPRAAGSGPSSSIPRWEGRRLAEARCSRDHRRARVMAASN